MATNYTFGEKKTETINGAKLEVILGDKYLISKEAAIKLLESEAGKELTENDFWIQKNKSRNGKYLIYSALIITHDALLKIDAALPKDRRFNQEYCSDPQYFDYAGKKGFYMTYRDTRDGMFEIGEITTDSCKNDYPFAMLLKRTFDRVVKRKANLFGIYSDAEDFSSDPEPEEKPATSGRTSRPATTSIPREEDEEEMRVDAETGEVLEEKPKAIEKPVPHPPAEKSVKEAPQPSAEEIPEEELTAEETVEVEAALSHQLEGLTQRDGKGYEIRKLISSSKLTDEQKEQRLQLFYTKGTEKDKAACAAILAAIEMGAMEFTNSKAS